MIKCKRTEKRKRLHTRVGINYMEGSDVTNYYNILTNNIATFPIVDKK